MSATLRASRVQAGQRKKQHARLHRWAGWWFWALRIIAIAAAVTAAAAATGLAPEPVEPDAALIGGIGAVLGGASVIALWAAMEHRFAVHEARLREHEAAAERRMADLARRDAWHERAMLTVCAEAGITPGKPPAPEPEGLYLVRDAGRPGARCELPSWARESTG